MRAEGVVDDSHRPPFGRSMAAQPWEHREKRHRRCGKPTPLLTRLSHRHAACLRFRPCRIHIALAGQEIRFLRHKPPSTARRAEVITTSSTRWRRGTGGKRPAPGAHPQPLFTPLTLLTVTQATRLVGAAPAVMRAGKDFHEHHSSSRR